MFCGSAFLNISSVIVMFTPLIFTTMSSMSALAPTAAATTTTTAATTKFMPSRLFFFISTAFGLFLVIILVSDI